MNKNLLGIGLYTNMEAARFTSAPAQNISNWLVGYKYKNQDGEETRSEPLWHPDLERGECNQIQMSFRDLMEVRFVNAFRKAGLSLQKIRSLYYRAQDLIDSERPFSTSRFHTDGKRIFLEEIASEESRDGVTNLEDYQVVFKKFIEPTFRDIEYEENAPILWKHAKGRAIVLDPRRSFGQPILEEYGIQTSVLWSLYNGIEDYRDVADIYDIPVEAVKEAVAFENRLNGI